MVTRIGTAAQNMVLTTRMVEQQQQVAQDQTIVATGLKSQDYAGIAHDTYDLLNVENQKARLTRYLSDNSLVQTNLKAQQTAVQGITETATTMRSLLVQFAGRDLSVQSPQNITDVKDLQTKAFAALSQIQYFLNQQIDGKYIFGGAISNQPPVSLPYNNLDDFQNTYDGIGTVFPSSRAANLVDLSFPNISATYTTQQIPPSGPTSLDYSQVTSGAGSFISSTIDHAATGNLVFSNVGANGKVTAATPGAFRSVQIGQTILINNSGALQGGLTDNNGVYTVTAVSSDGNTVTFDQPVNPGLEPAGGTVQFNMGVPDGTALALDGSTAGNNGAYTVKWPKNADLIAAGFNLSGGDIVSGNALFSSKPIPVPGASGEVVNFNSMAFLRGVSLPTQQKISDTQTIKLDVTGLDPAFEKAIRALGTIAQGDLLNNTDRIQQALSALNDSIQHSALQPTEAQSDLTSVLDRITNNFQVLTTAADTQNQFKAFLDGRQNDLLKADTTEAAVRLQTDSQALQISYASLSKITQLSLLNYL
jgi:flagellin-like hook-associated protein FlgL